jgi:hypothetical protein
MTKRSTELINCLQKLGTFSRPSRVSRIVPDGTCLPAGRSGLEAEVYSKDIAIDNQNAGGATLEDKTGILTRNMQLTANETKTLNFGFSVKYPKGRMVVGLR